MSLEYPNVYVEDFYILLKVVIISRKYTVSKHGSDPDNTQVRHSFSLVLISLPPDVNYGTVNKAYFGEEQITKSIIDLSAFKGFFQL